MTHVNHCDTAPGFTGDPAATLVSALIENGSETSIEVDDNSDFPSSRIIIIGSEEIFYTGVSGGDTFTGCIRGYGTSKPSHSPGETVTLKKDTCNDFDNYADAWLDCPGHADSSPELCPDAFQGDFHVDNSACYNDVSHVNSYAHTPHVNSAHVNNYSHTPHTNTAHYNSYSHTPHANYHLNTSHGHTPHANYHLNYAHSNSCGGWMQIYSGHYDNTCPSGYFCNWSNYPNFYDSATGSHLHSAGYNDYSHTPFYNRVAYNDYSHTPHYNVYSHTPYNHTAFYNYYSHTPYNHTPHYNVYSHTPHNNVYSHTPFVDFCNHTDHNAG